jgi:hypothetical protein
MTHTDMGRPLANAGTTHGRRQQGGRSPGVPCQPTSGGYTQGLTTHAPQALTIQRGPHLRAEPGQVSPLHADTEQAPRATQRSKHTQGSRGAKRRCRPRQKRSGCRWTPPHTAWHQRRARAHPHSAGDARRPSWHAARMPQTHPDPDPAPPHGPTLPQGALHLHSTHIEAEGGGHGLVSRVEGAQPRRPLVVPHEHKLHAGVGWTGVGKTRGTAHAAPATGVGAMLPGAVESPQPQREAEAHAQAHTRTHASTHVHTQAYTYTRKPTRTHASTHGGAT